MPGEEVTGVDGAFPASADGTNDDASVLPPVSLDGKGTLINTYA